MVTLVTWFPSFLWLLWLSLLPSSSRESPATQTTLTSLALLANAEVQIVAIASELLRYAYIFVYFESSGDSWVEPGDVEVSVLV
jgi:uncharacterized membrane protein